MRPGLPDPRKGAPGPLGWLSVTLCLSLWRQSGVLKGQHKVQTGRAKWRGTKDRTIIGLWMELASHAHTHKSQ